MCCPSEAWLKRTRLDSATIQEVDTQAVRPLETVLSTLHLLLPLFKSPGAAAVVRAKCQSTEFGIETVPKGRH